MKIVWLVLMGDVGNVGKGIMLGLGVDVGSCRDFVSMLIYRQDSVCSVSRGMIY